MLRLLRKRKGQNAAEYAILIGLVIAAAVAMQTYVKRGINAKIKDGVDAMTQVEGEVTSGIDLGTTEQYEPYYTDTDFDTVERSGETVVTTNDGGEVVRAFDSDTTNRSGMHKTLDTSNAP